MEKPAQQKIEFATKFIILGVGGFLIFSFCSLALIVELSYGEPLVMNPFLGVPIAFVSGLMILAGTGQWGRWAYMWIFLSIPIAALIWVSLSPFLSENQLFDRRWIDPRLLGILVFGLPMVLSYVFVRRYYLRPTKNKCLTITRSAKRPSGPRASRAVPECSTRAARRPSVVRRRSQT